MPTAPKITDEQFRAAAKRQYARDGEIEIDDQPPAPGVTVSRNEDGDDGAYVLAWVWVDNDSAAGAHENWCSEPDCDGVHDAPNED